MNQVFLPTLTNTELQGYLSDGFAYQGVAFSGYQDIYAGNVIQLWKNVPVNVKYSKYGEVAWIDYQQTSILIPQTVYEQAKVAPVFTTPVEPSATLPAQAGTVALTTPKTSHEGSGLTTNALSGAGGLLLLGLAVLFLGKKWKR